MFFCCCDYTVPVLVGFMHKTHLVRVRKRPCLDLKYRFKQCEIVPRSPKDIQVPLLQMLRMQSQTAATVWKAFWSNTNMSQFINYKWKWYDTCCGNVNVQWSAELQTLYSGDWAGTWSHLYVALLVNFFGWEDENKYIDLCMWPAHQRLWGVNLKL